MKKAVAALLAIALVLCLCTCKARERDTRAAGEATVYVLNRSTKKFHHADCRYVSMIKERNKQISYKSRAELLSDGYTPCKVCHP